MTTHSTGVTTHITRMITQITRMMTVIYDTYNRYDDTSHV